MATGLVLDEATLRRVADLCRQFHVARLDIFGSAVREDFDPERSDVDLIAAFEPGTRRNLEAHFDLIDRLEAVFGRKVDLLTDGTVQNPYLKEEIDAERRPLFVGS